MGKREKEGLPNRPGGGYCGGNPRPAAANAAVISVGSENYNAGGCCGMGLIGVVGGVSISSIAASSCT